MQFVRTLWQSKYGMLNSLLANKESVRRMCASDDECCSALHDQDLSDTEWQIVEVRASRSRLFSEIVLVVFCSGRNPYPFSNASLKSRSCSRVRTMCCHRHIGVLLWMLKSCWLHMQKIPHRLQRFEKRCMMIISAREWLWSSPFPMFCMSWWRCSIQGMLFIFFLFCCQHACIVPALLVRWRVHRAVKLTAEQWNRAKSLFLHYVPLFFPNNCMLPVFVALHDNVLMKMEELQQEHWPAPAAADISRLQIRCKTNSHRRKEGVSTTIGLLQSTWMVIVTCRWKRTKRPRRK